MKHLFFPASFFPSIGGAQGSLLNFLHCFDRSDKVVFALGMRSFFYAINKQRHFEVTIPYVGRIMRNDCILKYYLKVLAYAVKPDIVWLYGGGEMAARIMKYRNEFSSNTKFIIRSMGADIQHDTCTQYGTEKGTKEYKFITNMYKSADFLWALSDEIAKIYRRDVKIDERKIITCGNCIIRPKDFSIKPKSENITIGVIGRNHPKKNFILLNEIVDRLDPSIFNLVLKTPGFKLNRSYPNVTYEPVTKVKHLTHWPPKDVWEFYNKVDVLLVLSKVESFGNVTFEAGISGCSIVINKHTTGGDIASGYGFDVHTYNNFDVGEICAAVARLKASHKNAARNDLNIAELKLLIQKVKR